MGGVPGGSASSVVDTLTFSKELSADFQDCPLIPVEDKLCVLPSIGATILPAYAMLSNFSRRDARLEFKGKGLEERVKASVRAHGVRCEGVSASRAGQTYETDAAFVLSNDLYLVEVKSIPQPAEPKGFHRLNEKLEQFSAQHNRTCDYFVDHLGHVRDALRLADNWVPGEVIRLVVCSAMLGSPRTVNGCKTIDVSAFERYWSRKPLTINLGNKRLVIDGAQTHTGRATSQTLQSVIAAPPQISATEGILSHKRQTGRLGTVRYELPVVRAILSPFYTAGSRTYQEFEKLFERDEPFETS